MKKTSFLENLIYSIKRKIGWCPEKPPSKDVILMKEASSDSSSSILRSKYTKYRIITLCVIVLIAASAVVVWYYLSLPKIILTLEFEQNMRTQFIINNTFGEREVLPDPLEPLGIPNSAVISWGSCKITTAKGSASSFVMYMYNFVSTSSASQATNGETDSFNKVNYFFFFFVDNQNALELLSELGLPAQLVDINYLNKTIDESTNQMMVTISDGQDNLLLNLTFLYDSQPFADAQGAEGTWENDFAWLYGEEENFLTIRVHYTSFTGMSGYNFTKGIIETSSLLSIQKALGDKFIISPIIAGAPRRLIIVHEDTNKFTNP
jgi:hypothetical protein